jgi:type II pantothenate kinase
MQRSVKIMATGGGAHKFYELFRKELGEGVEVRKEDEMECLITGLSFITSIPNEVFWYSDELVYNISHLPYPEPTDPGVASSTSSSSSTASSFTSTLPSASTPSSSAPSSEHSQPSASSSLPPPAPQPQPELPRPSPNPPNYSVSFDPNPSTTHQFPCLLVNIGSGVSIVKVDADGSFERISGTSLGGGTLWGLLSLLTDAESFDGASPSPSSLSRHLPTFRLHRPDLL